MSNKSRTKEYVAANLAAWEEVAPIHEQSNYADLLERVRRPGFYCLDDTARAVLNRLETSGKDVAQVCCNNGQELISIKNMGAGRCVGFDGAQGFVDQARGLAEAANQKVEFVCCDAYDIPTGYHGCFDIVVITIGVLGWMPDIDGFFAEVEKLLKPSGAIFIYEHHPILIMLEPAQAGEPVQWELSYFRTKPYVDASGLDYYEGKDYGASPNVSFSHKLSDIIMAAVKTGLAVEEFEELPHHVSNMWWNVEHSGIGLPMCYTLVMRKAA